MLVAAEWSHYSNHKKSLRVSAPRLAQRSSYFLSMPFRFGIPLLVISAVAPWLASQSLFLIRAQVLPADGSNAVVQINNRVGFSPMASLLALILTTLMLLFFLGLGLLKKHPGVESSMPMVSTCSAAISAACHRHKDDVDAHLLPVQWGTIPEKGEIGHCSFTTALDIRHPQEGRLYA